MSQQNIEYMAKCAADSYMQSLMMRNPEITQAEKLYIEKYMEIFNKSLEIAERTFNKSQAQLEAEEKVAALFK